MRWLILFSFFSLIIGCTASENLQFPPGKAASPRLVLPSFENILSDSIFQRSLVGMKIVSVNRGDVLFEKNSRLLLRPASNMKLLATATAFSLLERDFQFNTTLHVDSLDKNGTVHGNLYLRGGGNPDLRLTDLDSIVSQIKQLRIRRITGDIVSDNSYYDTTWFGRGWMWDDEPFSHGAPISALSINENCVKVTVQAGRKHGDPAIVAIEPQTSYVSIINTARTVSDSVISPLRIVRQFQNRSNTIEIKGDILLNEGGKSELVSVWKPELFAATLLKEYLQKDKILNNGIVRNGLTPPGSRLLLTHTFPLDSVIHKTNKMSSNLSAESLLRTISKQSDSAYGTSEHGISLSNKYLASVGLDTLAFLIADGSGVSYYNLVSPETIVSLLLTIARDSTLFQRFYDSLPIAGIDGTLRSRMKGTPALGNLRAKTGTLSGISSLSGYVHSGDGELLAFSIMMQNFIGPSKPYRDVQDLIGSYLAQYRRRSGPLVSP